MIEPDAIRQDVIDRLPVRARWVLCGVPLTFDFSRCQAPLRAIEPTDIIGGDIQEPWDDLYLFAEQDYADGGGASPFLGIHRRTGEIFGLDVERDSPQTYLLNSSIDAFIRTFQEFDKALRSKGAEPLDLTNALMEIDPRAFPFSEWRELCNEIALARTQRCTWRP